ncbi:hypothetical protein LEP1GSC034_1703 [Leptospira interrogans str. 2003000735]|uniref:Uncharacterized protein n=11 Tax=Leptospira interrogans TaxID=173 RepID=A0A0E2D3V7_LEPIR|nr:hypothetical protein LEP1GSC045_3269 [Leptospira interrogans serovar Pomona str. Kennewicki LC82-25]EJP06110.1 hypothetical protein LEP1GSC007_3436 [Leptospira interrogans serovar Bulgarica str. Mallika]EKN88134.1 hypothetical protein LEP1GSC027_4694 [Leptospira interrogans str. 2002000624]EKN98908.1 hypothetical protein LEP1GSC014_2583 [Leptospira interrogans serovar Pomona str. Pomona]EKO04767.1 hypothetical protein LEP1GSC077_3705 [Leptospira interrogans str. C10069]EKO26938.1 hypothetic
MNFEFNNNHKTTILCKNLILKSPFWILRLTIILKRNRNYSH